jgi:hypothetical protein
MEDDIACTAKSATKEFDPSKMWLALGRDVRGLSVAGNHIETGSIRIPNGQDHFRRYFRRPRWHMRNL